MYEYLIGKLVEKKPTEIIVDVGGVGYLVQIPVSTHAVLPALGETVKVLTYFVVREDAQLLYGFASAEERNLFKLLITVSGIGPRMGLTLLSGLSVSELKRAIVNGEVHRLTSISGIGRKTAERIIVELRERLVVEGEKREEVARVCATPTEDSVVEDSLQALIKLGYRKQNAMGAIRKVLKNPPQGPLSVEDLIRESLKHV